MLKKIILPDIGEGIETVEITELNISTNKKINKDDILFTVETEKASMEISSEFDGIIKEIFIKSGQQISPNTIIATIQISNEIKSTNELNKSIIDNNIDIKKQINIPINLPEIGEGVENVEITDINVKINDNISKGKTILTVETEKASMEISSEFDGIIKEIFVLKGDKISPGSKILTLETIVQEKKYSKNQSDDQLENTISNMDHKRTKESYTNKTFNPINTNSKTIYTSPSVRRFARKLGCDLSLVTGTGPKGRILKEDVEQYISDHLNNVNSGITLPSLPEIDFSNFGKTEIINLTKIKKTTGNRLQTAWNSIPQVTQFDQADITALDIYRSKINKNKKMSFIPILIKALVPVLKEFPYFNSSLNNNQNRLILKKYFNIGIAVDTPNGLIVPVIKDVENKSIYTIMDELIDISKRARNKKIKPNELQGSSITISSLGGIGGTYFTPIVNPPEVAIIGISKASIQPLYDGEKFLPKKVLPISLTYDHRVIDGALAAKFTSLYCKYLNNFNTIPDIK